MILSGDRFGILEPLETIFLFEGKSSPGMSCSLEDLAKQEDQFEPFKRIGRLLTGDQNFGPIGSFGGTLFRFPLRTSPSNLSKTIYSGEKVGELFSAFKEESAEVILFLNNVKSVVLQDLSNPEETLITLKLLQDGEQKKKEFLRMRQQHFEISIQENEEKICVITNNEPVSASWSQQIIVEHGQKILSSQNWNVTSYISGRKDMDPNLVELSSSPKVCSLPQVGLANMISRLEDTSELDGPVNIECIDDQLWVVAGTPKNISFGEIIVVLRNKNKSTSI
jgi:sacsin